MMSIEALYRFYIDPYVKTYKGQKTTSANRLMPVIMECRSVEDFKIKVWNEFNSKLELRAIIPYDDDNSNQRCHQEPNSKIIENIDSYMYFEKGSHKYSFSEMFGRNFISLQVLQNFSSRTPGTVALPATSEQTTSAERSGRSGRGGRSGRSTASTLSEQSAVASLAGSAPSVAPARAESDPPRIPHVELFIFKYSDSITNSNSYTKFRRDCIQPTETDRSGAATENLLQQIVDKLHRRWDGKLPFVHMTLYEVLEIR